MHLIKLIKKTSGQKHGWYETDKGILIRKPLGQNIDKEFIPNLDLEAPIKKSLWQRIKEWIYGLFQGQ